MANRIVGSVLIVDSAAGNTFIMNTLSNSTGQIQKIKVNAVAFWSADTTGRLQVSEADTTGITVSFSWIGSQGGQATQTTSFGNSQPMEGIKVPTLTAGTAFFYLC